MNKLLKILTIALLVTVHHLSASNKENSWEENFQKSKDAWIKKFEENLNKQDDIIENNNQVLIFEKELREEVLKIPETKEEKQNRILKIVEKNIEENKNNKFRKVVNIKSILQVIIPHLDYDSCGSFAQVCKMTSSGTAKILEVFPDIAFKLSYIRLASHKVLLEQIVKKCLVKKKKSGLDFFWHTDCFFQDLLDYKWLSLSDYSKNLESYQNSLMFYKKLICTASPEHRSSPYAVRIAEEIIDPLFTYLANLGGEMDIGDLFKDAEMVYFKTKLTFFIENPLFPLLLNFMLKKGLTINNRLFLRICFFCSLDTIKLALDNTSVFDLNEKFPPTDEIISYCNKSPIEIIVAAKEGEGYIFGREDKNFTRPFDIMVLMAQKGADISGLKGYPKYYEKLRVYVKKNNK